MNSALARSWGAPTLLGSDVIVFSQAICSSLLTEASSAASCAFSSAGSAACAAPASSNPAISPRRAVFAIHPSPFRPERDPASAPDPGQYRSNPRSAAQAVENPAGRLLPVVDPGMGVR